MLISIYSVPQKPLASLKFTSSFVVEEISLTSTVSKLLLYHCSSQHWWNFAALLCWAVGDQACIFQKTQKLYRPEKPFIKLRPAYYLKLRSFHMVVKGIKIKITAKFRDTFVLKIQRKFKKRVPGRKLQGGHPHACFGESRTSRSYKLGANLCKVCMSQRWQTSKS